MKNWRTTVIGLIAAVFVAIKPMMVTGQVDWEQVFYAACIAAFGFFAKDFNVTGGTVPANNEATNRVTGNVILFLSFFIGYQMSAQVVQPVKSSVDTSAWHLSGNTNTGTRILGTKTATDISVFTNNSERISIKANGRVLWKVNSYDQNGTVSWSPTLRTLSDTNGVTTLEYGGKNLYGPWNTDSGLVVTGVDVPAFWQSTSNSGVYIACTDKRDPNVSTHGAYGYLQDGAIDMQAFDVAGNIGAISMSGNSSYLSATDNLGKRCVMAVTSGSLTVSSTNSLFTGIGYNSSTAAFVLTNQNSLTVLHRGGNDLRYGLLSGNLGQFGSTTSAQLAGVITDETGTGSLVFASGASLSSPTITTGSLGSSVATTQVFGDNSTKVATTAYVDANNLNLKLTADATTTNTVAATIGTFTFTGVAGATYAVIGYFRTECSGTGGMKFDVDVPGTSSLDVGFFGTTSGVSSFSSNRTNADVTLEGVAFNAVASGGLFVMVDGTITMDGTGGLTSFRFASVTSGQTSTVHKESFIKVTRIN